jgi:ABC-type lipoprotein export system ATPase subunit
MADKIIELKEVYKSYDSGPAKVDVLKGINLEIYKGEVVGIMGASGVGKSTLLHLIGMLDRPTSGGVFLNGTDVQGLSRDELAKYRNEMVGFVFQFHHLLPEFTALENVMIPVMMYGGRDLRKKEEYARYILDEVGLSHRVNHRPNELSGGEQQRVAVARALINDPQALLTDEPTGNLDKQNSEALYRLLLDINKKLNQTLVIVTHDDQIEQAATRIIHLDDGRVVA